MLTDLFGFHIPQRWTIAHLYQAILNGEPHVADIDYVTTLAGYIQWKMTGERVVGVGEDVYKRQHPVSAEVRSTPDIPRAAALALNFFLITIPPVISGQRVLSFVLCNRSSNRLLSLSLS